MRNQNFHKGDRFFFLIKFCDWESVVGINICRDKLQNFNSICNFHGLIFLEKHFYNVSWNLGVKICEKVNFLAEIWVKVVNIYNCNTFFHHNILMNFWQNFSFEILFFLILELNMLIFSRFDITIFNNFENFRNFRFEIGDFRIGLEYALLYTFNFFFEIFENLILVLIFEN